EEPRLVLAVTHEPREAVYLARRILVLGPPPEGPVLDEEVDLSPEERAYGQGGHLEGRLIRVL
ncbi:MAG: ABC transporter ATP-binding protein, partial [Treponema sp.]|nr:ABC transporter ATP-binding protein [Treponema sp.]